MTRVLKIMPFALLGLAVAVSGCNRGEAAQTDGQAETALVTRRSLLVQAEAAGEIEPIRVIEVKSKASGEVLTLSFETGDYVERGTLLATIDPRDVQNAFDQAQADLAVAEARAQTSEAQRQRTEELRAANVVTAQELESAQLDVANQQASLIRARTNLTLARERLNDVRITAPLTGTVIEKTVEIGQIIASATGNVSGGTTLLKMADLSQMQVRSLIDETDLAQMRAGLPVQVTVDAYPDRRFNGQVLKIEPQAVIEQNVTSFPVLVMLDNSEGLLKPGMNADVVIEIATRDNVLVVPNAAVVGTQDAVPAGAVLGLSEDEVNAGLRERPAPAPAPQAAGDSTAPANTQAAAAGGAEECTAIFRKIRDTGGAQNLTDAERATLEACRAQMAGQTGRAGGRGGRTGQGGQGGQFAQGGRNGQAGQAGQAGQGGRGNRGGIQAGLDQRPGVVFVVNADGSYSARSVTLGLNDFDYAEVIRGLNEGDKVVMISVARLQQQQQEFLDRMRDRAGSQGPIPGGSGGGPGMGGGGRGGR